MAMEALDENRFQSMRLDVFVYIFLIYSSLIGFSHFIYLSSYLNATEPVRI